MYLLDTNVVSELRRSNPHGAVAAWIQNTDIDQIHIASVTIGEIQAGIEITRGQDDAKADEIEAWLEHILKTFIIVPMDVRMFREWARLMHRKSDDLIVDAMIAATAIVNGMTVATRNVRDFEPFDVAVYNPFEYTPS